MSNQTDFAKKDDVQEIRTSEDGLAMYWLSQHPHTAWGLGEWRRYEHGAWPAISAKGVKKEITETCQEAMDSASATKVSNIEKLASYLSFIEDTVWDSGRNTLVLNNGVLDLSTMQIRKHDPADYATRRLNYDYDPGAGCEAFQTALGALPGDVRDFLQEFAGYCLTTDTRQELAVWFYGVRGSGKSTILAGFEALLGDYAGYLSLANLERSQFALANVPGKRLLIASESPERYISQTHLLNSLISGETLTVERKYHDSFTLRPYAKVLWAMNSLPRVADAQDGLFRRVKIVTFEKITYTQRDETLKERIALEGAGILNWALEGLKRLQERGRFAIPDSVTQAVEDFQNDNDKALLFVSEACECDPSYQTKASDLYQAYRLWCFGNGLQPESNQRMGREWKRLGFTSKRITAGYVWDGLRVI